MDIEKQRSKVLGCAGLRIVRRSGEEHRHTCGDQRHLRRGTGAANPIIRTCA